VGGSPRQKGGDAGRAVGIGALCERQWANYVIDGGLIKTT
jgi:hypothetical protein